MFKIIDIQKDDNGQVIAFRLDNGKLICRDTGIQMIRGGKIEGVIMGANEYGEKTIHLI